jgi:isoquinoline 1-oxidoreductase subunit alpha
MVSLRINGEMKAVDAPPDMPLLWVLRDILGMTGTKFGCGIAQCGACTVHVDGAPVRSCLLSIGSIGQRAVTTIEGVGASAAGAKVQKAWLDLDDIDAAMAGNICRCGTYVRIREAIKHAAQS